MCKILSRINDLAEHEGISIAVIERTIGASRGVISKAIKNGTDIQSKWLTLICDNFPKYSAEWLLTGSGDMLRSTKPQTSVANDSFSSKDDINSQHSNQSERIWSTNGVPLIPVHAMAGFLTGEMSVNEADCERLYIPGLKADFVIPVSGDSMEPRYFSGDLVACQYVALSDCFFQWGKVYVIDTNQGILIKRVRKDPNTNNGVVLISENSDYDPIKIPISDIHHIALVKGLVRIE